VGSIPALAAT